MSVVIGSSARVSARSGATGSVLVLREKTNNLCANFALANNL